MNNNKNENDCESELIKENEILKCKYLELEKEVGGLKEENELLEKDLKMKNDKVCLLDNKLLELNEVVCKKEEEIKLLKTEIDENKRNEDDIETVMSDKSSKRSSKITVEYRKNPLVATIHGTAAGIAGAYE